MCKCSWPLFFLSPSFENTVSCCLAMDHFLPHVGWSPPYLCWQSPFAGSGCRPLNRRQGCRWGLANRWIAWAAFGSTFFPCCRKVQFLFHWGGGGGWWETVQTASCTLIFFKKKNPHLRIYLLILERGRERKREKRGREREKGGEREKETERERLISCLLHASRRGSNMQPSYVPWPGTELTTFWCMGWRSNPGLCVLFLIHVPVSNCTLRSMLALMDVASSTSPADSL